MSEEEGYNPYKERKKQVYAWLCCWNRIREGRCLYEKNIGKEIAKMLPVDFSQGKFGSFSLKNDSDDAYYWSGEGKWRNFAFVKPCVICFAPTIGPSISVEDETMIATYRCLRNHFVIYSPSTLLPKCCGPTALCNNCAEKIAERENLILPENKKNE